MVGQIIEEFLIQNQIGNVLYYMLPVCSESVEIMKNVKCVQLAYLIPIARNSSSEWRNTDC